MTNIGARISTLLSLTALLFVAVPRLSFAAPPLGISLMPPAVSFEFDDLDLRDAQNRPIKSAVVRADMRRLFESNLTRMLIENLTPVQRSVRIFLSSAWERWQQMLRRSIPSRHRTTVPSLQQRRERVWRAPLTSAWSVVFTDSGSHHPEFSSHQQPLLSSFLESTRLLC